MERKTARFEGMTVSYLEGGQGEPLLLSHGSGPGASSVGNWRLLLPLLEQHFHTIAVDLIGFGESERKKSGPYFDLDLWSRQLSFALNLFREDQVNVLGHSLSGYLMLQLASRDRRVKKAMATCSMGNSFPINEHMQRIWSFPPTREAIRQAGESLVWDLSVLNDEYISGRERVLHGGDYDQYFEQLFQGDKQLYIDAAVLTDAEIANIACPVLLVHGRNDLPIPFSHGVELAERMPWADFIALARCGHSPALEQTARLAQITKDFFMPEGC
ncbi:alpha/beta hydrolase [Herbaspirillum sp. LeCh32-8]|nr:alpha/beta hydrolase [Herbaspirillum sp. LeCh32-8]